MLTSKIFHDQERQICYNICVLKYVSTFANGEQKNTLIRKLLNFSTFGLGRSS